MITAIYPPIHLLRVTKGQHAFVKTMYDAASDISCIRYLKYGYTIKKSYAAVKKRVHAIKAKQKLVVSAAEKWKPTSKIKIIEKKWMFQWVKFIHARESTYLLMLANDVSTNPKGNTLGSWKTTFDEFATLLKLFQQLVTTRFVSAPKCSVYTRQVITILKDMQLPPWKRNKPVTYSREKRLGADKMLKKLASRLKMQDKTLPCNSAMTDLLQDMKYIRDSISSSSSLTSMFAISDTQNELDWKKIKARTKDLQKTFFKSLERSSLNFSAYWSDMAKKDFNASFLATN